MFRIDDQGLEEFIPAFADAIKEPLFTVENIKKEINKVNSKILMRMTYNKNLSYYKQTTRADSYVLYMSRHERFFWMREIFPTSAGECGRKVL